MVLPLTRDETAVPDAPVRSALLNSIQDQIIGGKHGAFVRNISATVMGVPLGTGITRQAAGYQVDTAASQIHIHIPLLVGERITAVTVFWKDADATRFLQAQMWVQPGNGTAAVSKSAQVSSAKTGAWHTTALTSVVSTLAIAGDQWFVSIVVNGSTLQQFIAGLAVTIEMP